jgi:hypothetical protein
MRLKVTTFLLSVLLLAAMLPPALAGTRGAHDGFYKGNVKGSPTVKVTHKVAGNGSKLKKFRVRITATCVIGTSIVFRPVSVGIGTPKIRNNGKFSGRHHPSGNFDVRYSGRVRSSGKATGHVEGQINQCSVKFDWVTHRQ